MIQDLAKRVYGADAVVLSRDGMYWVRHRGKEAMASKSSVELQKALEGRLNESLMTVAEAAFHLGVGRQTISSSIMRGLPVYKRDEHNKPLFRQVDLDAWREQHPAKPGSGKKQDHTKVGKTVRRPWANNGVLSAQIGVGLQKQVMDAYEIVQPFGVSYALFVSKLIERGLAKR